MKAFLSALCLASLTLHAAEPSARVVDLCMEGRQAPGSVSAQFPRLGWRVEATERGWLQQSYHILVASDPGLLGKDEGDLWDSGPVGGRVSQWVRYEGTPLQHDQVIHWKVRVTDRNGKPSPWSEPASTTISLVPPCPTSPSPLDAEQAVRLSSFECSDPGLTALFGAAAAAVGEIDGLDELGLSLRGLSFHTPLLPEANHWLNLLNQSTYSSGFYPATLPADGSYGSVSSDAAIMAAHALWWTTGDSSCYDRHLGSMKRYIFARKQFAQQYPDTVFGTAPADALPEGDPTPATFLDDATQALNVRLLMDLGRLASKDPYELYSLKQYSDSLPASFAEAHLFPDHTLQYESLTAQLLTLRAGVLMEETQKKAVADQLLANLRKRGDRPVLQESPLIAQNLLPVLTWLGHDELALQILRAHPPEQLEPAALVNCSEWLLSMLAGISSLEPGFTFIHLNPRIPPKDVLQEVKASFQSPLGTIASHWSHDDEGLLYVVTIPPNTLAQIDLPTAGGSTVTENGSPLEDSPLFFSIRKGEDTTSFQAGSGTYRFRVK